MNSGTAKVPDSNTDWKSIDIFVFSNGQQYSPPRKYHLCTDDLHLWNSTLSFLAKSQYGSVHSFIDLFTIDGRKVSNPLELSNGAAYVAVEPTDMFVEAGYDKYLLRATRSYEKRLAKKNENVDEPDKPMYTGVVVVDFEIEGTNIKSREESEALKTIVSSLVDNHEASIIVKPKPLTTSQRKAEASSAKLTDSRKASDQRPTIIRKINPTMAPTQYLKPSFKKRESVRSANVKIIRPEGDKATFGPSSSNPAKKLIAKSKVYGPTTKPKETPKQLADAVQSRVQKTVEIKKPSSIKETSKNDRKISINSAELGNVIENTEIVLVSNVYQNPYKGDTSISVDPNPMEEMKLVKDNKTSATHSDNVKTVILNGKENQNISELKTIARKSSNGTVKYIEIPTKIPLITAETLPANYYVANVVKEYPKINSEIKVIAIKSSNETIKVHESPLRRHSILADEQYITYNIIHKPIVNNRNNDIKINAFSSKDNNIIDGSSPQKLLIMAEENLSIVEENKINSNIQITNTKHKEMITLDDQPPSKHFPDATYNVSHTVEENKIDSDIQITNTKHKEMITHDDQPLFKHFPDVTYNVSHTVEENKINSDIQITNTKHKEMITLDDQPPHLILTDKLTDEHYAAHTLTHTVEDNININSEVKPSETHENIQTHDFTTTLNTTATDTFIDNHYVSILSKGDVVSLKLNIEIQNNDGVKNTNNETNSVPNLLSTERGSQINISNPIITPNKSLLSIITKEIKDIGDHHVIIVQYSNCKFCNDHTAEIPKRSPRTSYIFLLPVEKFEENMVGCNCDRHSQQQNRNSSILNPLKATYSCMSLQRLTKPSQGDVPAGTVTQNISIPGPKIAENVITLETKTSENDVLTVSRKKSVAINEESKLNSRETSKISHELSIETKVIAVRQESTGNILTFMDNFAQTDWCDVMLEARLLEDGHYEFRLPTLEVLKHYKLEW